MLDQDDANTVMRQSEVLKEAIDEMCHGTNKKRFLTLLVKVVTSLAGVLIRNLKP